MNVQAWILRGCRWLWCVWSISIRYKITSFRRNCHKSRYHWICQNHLYVFFFWICLYCMCAFVITLSKWLQCCNLSIFMNNKIQFLFLSQHCMIVLNLSLCLLNNRIENIVVYCIDADFVVIYWKEYENVCIRDILDLSGRTQYYVDNFFQLI